MIWLPDSALLEVVSGACSCFLLKKMGANANVPAMRMRPARKGAAAGQRAKKAVDERGRVCAIGARVAARTARVGEVSQLGARGAERHRARAHCGRGDRSPQRHQTITRMQCDRGMAVRSRIQKPRHLQCAERQMSAAGEDVSHGVGVVRLLHVFRSPTR